MVVWSAVPRLVVFVKRGLVRVSSVTRGLVRARSVSPRLVVLSRVVWSAVVVSGPRFGFSRGSSWWCLCHACLVRSYSLVGGVLRGLVRGSVPRVVPLWWCLCHACLVCSYSLVVFCVVWSEPLGLSSFGGVRVVWSAVPRVVPVVPWSGPCLCHACSGPRCVVIAWSAAWSAVPVWFLLVDLRVMVGPLGAGGCQLSCCRQLSCCPAVCGLLVVTDVVPDVNYCCAVGVEVVF